MSEQTMTAEDARRQLEALPREYLLSGTRRVPWVKLTDAERIVYKLSAECERLRAQLAAAQADTARLREALQTIADTDFRGNRSHESALAYRALRENPPTLRAALDAARGGEK